MPVAVGETFERYEIESLLGRGGWSEVYCAVDTRLRRKVALKVVRPDKGNPDAEARLFREARAVAGLTHPNTVAIHDIGEAEGVFYIVMELVSGKPLLAYVGDPRVSLPRRLKWLVDMARALAAAHKAGIVHRDVKPSNVMVSDDDVVKVLDFGLAKPLTAPISFRTKEGQLLGTPRYMAPEQGMGAEVDARCDQWSFGITAWELLAGKHPGGILSENPVPAPLHEVRSEIPVAISEVFVRVLSTAPEARYPAMEDIVVALEDAIAGRSPRMVDPLATTKRMSHDPEAAVPTISVPGDVAITAGQTLRMTNAAAATALRISQTQLSPPTTKPPPPLVAETTMPAAEAPPITTLMSHGAPRLPDEIVAATPKARAAEKPALTADAVDSIPPPPLREPRSLTIAVVLIAVLGICAFAGSYIASKEIAKPPAPPQAAPAAS